ncbi:MAG: hypothetical protein ACP6IU_06520 [Candidatus Asgardarchaeia archaeon]
MIHAIYVIHKTSGLNIYKRFQGDISINENLFSGFISALFTFIKEVSHKTIERVTMDEQVLLLHETDNCILSALIDLEESCLSVKNKLIALGSYIEHNYAKETLNNWTGDLGIFHELDSLVDSLFFKNVVFDKLSSVKKYLDLLDTLPDISVYGLLSINGDFIFLSQDNRDIRILVAQSFDSLVSNDMYLNHRSIDKHEGTHILHTKHGSLIFTGINDEVVLFTLNTNEKTLGLALTLVEKVASRIEYTLQIEKKSKNEFVLPMGVNK